MARIKNNIDFTEEDNLIPIQKEVVEEKLTYSKLSTDKQLISCLQNKRVIVRYILKPTSLIRDSRHSLYGGMSENATKTYTVPVLRSGQLVDVLTKAEKEFLELEMGLEYNALSVHKMENNFWSNDTEGGISQVVLHKQDNYLDLSVPTDYIKYKILLANKNYIAASLDEYNKLRKATYEYYIINEGDEDKAASESTDNAIECYTWLSNNLSDIIKLRVVVELLSGKTTTDKVELSWLKAECGKYITKSPKLFIKIVNDPLLDSKVLIKKGLMAGLIINREGFYYLAENNTPLCEPNEESNIEVASKFISSPKNQGVKFMLQEKTR